MISKEMEKAVLEQINAELYSEYLYLSMKAYFASLNLNGFVNWMDVQVQEEHAHAMGMYDYVIERGGKVELFAIEKPECDWDSPLAVFEAVLKNEEYVTSRINALMDVAEETKDRAAMIFLNWYLKEQVEEENKFRTLLEKMENIDNYDCEIMHIDRNLKINEEYVE